MTTLRDKTSALSTHPFVLALIAGALVVSAMTMSEGTVQILCFMMIGIMFAQSVNLLTGIAGQISLGHAGFFGIGAYACGILAKNHGLELYLSVPLGAALAALAAYLLSFPARRVRDVYLAMMTLGFGMVFFEIVREWNDVTGGMMGLPGVPSASLKTLTLAGYKLDIRGYFIILLAATAVYLVVMGNITRSRIGRAFFAIHHSEIAAGSLGISRGGTKQLAYTISGAAAGLSGGFYAHLVGYLGPDSFSLHRSIEVLVVAIVGGLGSIPGQVIGAAIFTFLPEKLQIFSEYQYIVYGLILTFSLILLPRGIAGLVMASPRFIRKAALRRAAGIAQTPLGPGLDSGSDDKVLEVKGVTMRFGGLTALADVSLSLAAGRITALVGPNGSGKSTMVNVVSGLYRPSSGGVSFRGDVITSKADHQVAQKGMIRTFQDPRLVPNFTVRENLMLGAHRLMKRSNWAIALGLPAATEEEARFLAKVEQVIALIDLGEVADRQLDSLPYGYRRLTDVGRALLAEPVAILLDEPAAGLAEPEMARLAKLVRDMKAMGIAILLIDHHMDFLADLVDEVVVLDSGRLIYQGTMEGMREDTTVIAAYLGREETADA
jgi:ABC-type branched-subunit amino acid transport system ATPase component/ABC-type branched-subunit amino acid transport system permease subunit